MSLFTNEQLEQALVGATSIKDVIQNLGLNVNNGQYRHLKSHFLKAGIELPNFPAKHGPGNSQFHKKPDEEFFAENTSYGGAELKKRMLFNGAIYECSECGIGPEWNGKNLTIQVDHIDGDRFNNLRSNLRFLCPNCHTQTETYGSKARKRYFYCACGNRMWKSSLACRTCTNKLPRPSKIEWPAPEEVARMVTDSSFVQVGKALGVSDNTVRNYLTRNDIDVKLLK